MEEEKKTLKGEMLLSDVALTFSRAHRRAMGRSGAVGAAGPAGSVARDFDRADIQGVPQFIEISQFIEP